MSQQNLVEGPAAFGDAYRLLAGDRPVNIANLLATQAELEGFEPPGSGKLFRAAELS